MFPPPRPGGGVVILTGKSGTQEFSCRGARQLHVSTSSVWLNGTKGSKTLKDRRTFRAQELGQRHGAPTTDGDEEGYEIYSKEHGNEAHELYRREDALFSAWRDEGDLKV